MARYRGTLHSLPPMNMLKELVIASEIGIGLFLNIGVDMAPELKGFAAGFCLLICRNYREKVFDIHDAESVGSIWALVVAHFSDDLV